MAPKGKGKERRRLVMLSVQVHHLRVKRTLKGLVKGLEMRKDCSSEEERKARLLIS